MGLQVIPIGTLTSCTTTPKRARSDEAAGEPALWTLLQHWTGAVLHWLAGGLLLSPGTGVATARAERVATNTNEANLANIF